MRSIESIEDLGLESQVCDHTCEGCIFNEPGGGYSGVECKEVPCTPYSMDGLDVIWVKRASPQ